MDELVDPSVGSEVQSSDKQKLADKSAKKQFQITTELGCNWAPNRITSHKTCLKGNKSSQPVTRRHLKFIVETMWRYLFFW